MIRVETFIQNPTIANDNHGVERYLSIDSFSVINKEELLYGYIEIYNEDTKVFESTIEVLPDYWFISLQMIEELFQEGVGSWEFPTLLKFETVDADTILIQQNEELYHFPKKTLIKAMLDACTVFVHASEKFLNYPYPYELVKEKYLKIIEELHEKNNAL